MYSYASPCHALVPPLVMVFTTPPVLQPYSASYIVPWTLISWTVSEIALKPTPTAWVLLEMPSTRTRFPLVCPFCPACPPLIASLWLPDVSNGRSFCTEATTVTPGENQVVSMELRPRRGMAWMRAEPIVQFRSPDSVWRMGAFAVTLMDWATLPSCKVKFTTAFCPTVSVTPLWTIWLKPCFSTVKVYCPGFRKGS